MTYVEKMKKKKRQSSPTACCTVCGLLQRKALRPKATCLEAIVSYARAIEMVWVDVMWFTILCISCRKKGEGKRRGNKVFFPCQALHLDKWFASSGCRCWVTALRHRSYRWV